MRLLEICFERYKPFKERRNIALAPTTILIGKNASGKSAFCRLLLLLAQAVSEDPNGVLDLGAGGIDHAATFDDLIYERSSLPFMLGMTIGDSNSRISIENRMRYVAEKKEIAIERCAIFQDSRQIFLADLKDFDDLIAEKRVYKVKCEGARPRLREIDFFGMLPRHCDTQCNALLLRVAEAFRRALPMPSYLGPFREEPKEIIRTPSTIIKSLGPRGERAMEILANDKIRHEGFLLKDVDRWFDATFKGQAFEIDVSSNLPRVTIFDKGANIRVALGNTGAGFSQALPIVVQNFGIRHRRLPSNIMIVEQPELHLHPAAHGALADLFMDTTKPSEESVAPICVVETHSEQFLMRIRRRIAEGRNPEDFTLLSFAHANSDEGFNQIPIEVIKFDIKGNPSDWPMGVFEETFDDLTKLRQAARRYPSENSHS